MIRSLCLLTAIGLMTAPAMAQTRPGFTKGPVIENYGENAQNQSGFTIPEDMVFKVAFDIADQAEPGKLSRRLNTPARFINMHVRAGVPEDNLHAAVVVHGKAAFDLLTNEAYKSRVSDSAENANAPLIAELMKHNVSIYLCGQTAAAYNIKPEDLVPGIQMPISAITAHAWLQQNGYTLNPF